MTGHRAQGLRDLLIAATTVLNCKSVTISPYLTDLNSQVDGIQALVSLKHLFQPLGSRLEDVFIVIGDRYDVGITNQFPKLVVPYHLDEKELYEFLEFEKKPDWQFKLGDESVDQLGEDEYEDETYEDINFQQQLEEDMKQQEREDENARDDEIYEAEA